MTNRTLEQAAAIAGVDAVLVEAAGPDGGRFMKTLGMLDEEATRTAVPVPDNDNIRAVEVVFHYRLDDVESASPVVRSGVVVPLRDDGLPIGSLAAFTRTAAGKLSDAEVDELEQLASRAGPAFENARRYTDARSLADIDALTTLHNRRYFYETLSREVARAHRHHRLLSLIVLDLDNFKAINDKIGHLAGDGVLTEIGRANALGRPRGGHHVPGRRRRVRRHPPGSGRRRRGAARRTHRTGDRGTPDPGRRHPHRLGRRRRGPAWRHARGPLPAGGRGPLPGESRRQGPHGRRRRRGLSHSYDAPETAASRPDRPPPSPARDRERRRGSHGSGSRGGGARPRTRPAGAHARARPESQAPRVA